MQLLDPQTGLVVWDASWGVPAPQGGRYIEFDGPTAEMRQPAPRVNALEQMFNGTGIPERVNALNQTFNPVNAMGEAGRQAGIMLDPETSPMGRVGALGGMLTGMSGAVLPMAVAARYGGSAANAVTEAMTGFAPKGNAFLADEFGGLKIATGANLDDALRAAYPDAKISVSGSPQKGFTLNRIELPKDMRGRGVGTQIMRDLIEAADDMGATVKLSPSSDFGGSVPKLREFYKRFGFVENKGRNTDYSISESMYRAPNGPSTPSR